ncbi:TPA: hypothetical protein I8412_002952 [Citrobacter freundii]|uniref:hypothetical protein n=1 Tax=Citrobacter freundii TaxID=546 RepID=UPI0019980954|nr:hypothetical protein [Citrobacter freundii]HAN3786613.1 hypothetical protein [Escherichia coli]MCR3689022.1 hypothetical protein [Citrobacter freundii]MDT7344745.1 hypothetical protein [Citrobacter freundii]HAN4700260.1 hypothetical protein [Escherichia coli]HAT2218179.1 hypothetical protein [Citrobacter freundii]
MNAFTFKNCSFNDNGIGISAPADVAIKAEGTTFTNNGKAVEIRDKLPPEISSLFSEGVSKKKLLELIENVRKDVNPEPDSVARRLKKLGLSKWIANGANVVTVGTAIVQIISKLYNNN